VWGLRRSPRRFPLGFLASECPMGRAPRGNKGTGAWLFSPEFPSLPSPPIGAWALYRTYSHRLSKSNLFHYRTCSRRSLAAKMRQESAAGAPSSGTGRWNRIPMAGYRHAAQCTEMERVGTMGSGNYPTSSTTFVMPLFRWWWGLVSSSPTSSSSSSSSSSSTAQTPSSVVADVNQVQPHKKCQNTAAVTEGRQDARNYCICHPDDPVWYALEERIVDARRQFACPGLTII
jgi:hypothetical protein